MAWDFEVITVAGGRLKRKKKKKYRGWILVVLFFYKWLLTLNVTPYPRELLYCYKSSFGYRVSHVSNVFPFFFITRIILNRDIMHSLYTVYETITSLLKKILKILHYCPLLIGFEFWHVIPIKKGKKKKKGKKWLYFRKAMCLTCTWSYHRLKRW